MSATARLSIAHVIATFGVGGQERVVVDLVRVQRRLGHDVIAVSLAAGEEGPMGEELRAAGARTFNLPKGAGVDTGLPARLAALFLLERVQIVHTHNPQPLVYAGAAARLVGAKVVHTRHGVNRGSERQLWLRRAAGRLAHVYVAVSRETAELAREEGDAPAARLRVVENGIDLSRFAPDAELRAAVRAELGIPEGAFVAGTVGRVVEAKDHAFLVRALAPSLGPGFHVVIAGTGDLEDALRAQVAALPGQAASHVHVLGLRRDVPRLLAAFDVFVLSSRFEGLPLVLPEAMAAGLPSVATAVGGVPGVVRENVTGYLVPHGDEVGLRARVGELASDADKRARLGRRAREVALADYSAERMAAEYLSIYREVLGR
jgi:glycosyltransferase involved in cell wall biosynthesis